MGTPQTVDAFVLEYFSKTGPIPGRSDDERRACDYLQAGLLDSFGLIELITTLEKKFSLSLTSEDLENPKFKTIGGLIEIVAKKINAKSKTARASS
jgi:acyl carrier protein